MSLIASFVAAHWLLHQLACRSLGEHGDRCPTCELSLLAHRDVVGATGRCPRCGGRVLEEPAPGAIASDEALS
jgi:hypothetical protein